MLQETADEFFSGHGTGLGFASLGGPVAKDQMRVGHLDDTLVAYGDAEDVRSQILQC